MILMILEQTTMILMRSIGDLMILDVRQCLMHFYIFPALIMIIG